VPPGAPQFNQPGFQPASAPPVPQNGNNTAWWTNATTDPWRDPQAPAVVVTSPPGTLPQLESMPQMMPPAKRGVGLGLVLMISLVSALFAGVLGGTLGYVFSERNRSNGTQLGSKPGTLTQRAPGTLAELVKKALPSVVTIRVKVQGGTSLGSGFIVSNTGYIVTNNHVVEDGTGQMVVSFSDATTASAALVGSDAESDLAVIKVEKAGLTAVEIGNSDAVAVGDPVVAIGSPLGLTNTVTYGIVSALDRPIRTSENGGGSRYYSAIQTDAAVNQGNSGGPLFDGSGRVIGVNSVISSLSEDQAHAGNVGLAFAIPSNQTKRVAEEIISSGKAKHTVIGADIDVNYDKGGSKLTTIASGGPAEKAGLRTGDVVTKVGTATVEESWDMVALVRRYAPGTAVAIEYQRSGTRQTVQVTLTADAK
jgi:putative serine protease PepD